MRKSALIIAALLAAGSIAAAADATANVGSQAATTLQTRSRVTSHRPNSSVPCWKTWQSVRDTLLHHTAPPGCGKTATFLSKLYRYSIVLPGATSRWSSIFATQRWLDTSIPGIGDPQLDTFTDRKTGRTYLLAAQPTGSSLEKWAESVIAARPPVCMKPTSPKRATLAGEHAELVTWSCTDHFRVIVITALHAGRGFFMLQATPIGLAGTSDLPAFNAIRQSFRFTR